MSFVIALGIALTASFLDWKTVGTPMTDPGSIGLTLAITILGTVVTSSWRANRP